MFENDLYPGKPKILFVGNPTSAHVQGWMNLLSNAQLNIRLFASAEGYPAQDWPVKVYLITQYPPVGLDPEWRKSWWPEPEKWFAYEAEKQKHKEALVVEEFQNFFRSSTLSFARLFQDLENYYKTIGYEESRQKRAGATGPVDRLRLLSDRLINEVQKRGEISQTLDEIYALFQELQIGRFTTPLRALTTGEAQAQSELIQLPVPPASVTSSPQNWLAEVIKEWQPDIIHTFGLDAGSQFYYEARKAHHLEAYGKWIIKIFGGSDLAFTLHHPEICRLIGNMFSEATQVLFDNLPYTRKVIDLGLLAPEKVCPLTPIPGSGGVAVDDLVRRWQGQPSSRRVIVWPKSYETTWSKAVPAMLALRKVWDQIQPCEIHMLTATGETKEWFATLPEEMKAHCHIYEGLPRSKVLDLLLSARVMLAPSLIDGVPNSMYEAMACGAVPIVSPLETITEVVNDANVLFAENLDQPAIERAIVRAMTDDALVDEMTRTNLRVAKQLADIQWIQPKVQAFYENFA